MTDAVDTVFGAEPDARRLRRNDWIGLALCWLSVAEAALAQAARLYARSRVERHEKYERARDAIVERLRQERYLLRTERAILQGLARERSVGDGEVAA